MKQRDIRRVVDVGVTTFLLLQTAYQEMGEAAFEWLAMDMTKLVIVHQGLNRRWYDGDLCDDLVGRSQAVFKNGMSKYLFFRAPFAFLDCTN